MKDALHRVLKTVDHNRYVAGLCVLLIVGLVWFVGCKSTTLGLVPVDTPDGPRIVRVDRRTFDRQIIDQQTHLAKKRSQLDAAIVELNEEIRAHNQHVDTGWGDLDRQDEFKRKIIESVGGLVTQLAAGSINPVNAGISLLLVVGAGLGVTSTADARRKDKTIARLKADAKDTAKDNN